MATEDVGVDDDGNEGGVELRLRDNRWRGSCVMMEMTEASYARWW